MHKVEKKSEKKDEKKRKKIYLLDTDAFCWFLIKTSLFFMRD